jgi:hypothetical protein
MSNIIDYSKLSNAQPKVDYDTSVLEQHGLVLRFALDPNNIIFNQVLSICNDNNINYQIIESGFHQKHIWIDKTKLSFFKN